MLRGADSGAIVAPAIFPMDTVSMMPTTQPLDARLQHFGCPNALLIMHEFAINQRSHKPHSLTAKTRLLTGVGTAVRYYFVIRA
jgi:hypothetical protein